MDPSSLGKWAASWPNHLNLLLAEVCDVNGWSFVKANHSVVFPLHMPFFSWIQFFYGVSHDEICILCQGNQKYYNDCASLIRQHLLVECGVRGSVRDGFLITDILQDFGVLQHIATVFGTVKCDSTYPDHVLVRKGWARGTSESSQQRGWCQNLFPNNLRTFQTNRPSNWSTHYSASGRRMPPVGELFLTVGSFTRKLLARRCDQPTSHWEDQNSTPRVLEPTLW